MRRDEDGLTSFDLIKLGKGVGLRGVWAKGEGGFGVWTWLFISKRV